jgi:hypothetical protein
MCYHYITPHFYYIYITLLFNKRISLNKILGKMMNRDLLKEAIADAKAVKETAIANAKAVLEEVFTKNLRAELASKLEEMDNYENMEVGEAMHSKKEKDMMEEFEVNEGKDGIEEEFDLNEILAGLEEDEDAEEEMEAGEEEIEAGEEAEMEAGEMGDEEVDLEDMTEDDLKSFIEDVIADMVAAGELEAGEEMEAEMGDMEAEDEMGDMEELDEMDEVSWNDKNGRGETMKNLAPTKVGQTTSANGINLDESIADPNLMDMVGQMEELKKELQEVNLLNAKLLYTNKIFKEKTLNESQKLRVLKAFDKASSVKEAKIIFETLNEGMVSKTTKSSMVNEIKSSASKATGFISESKQPIVEVDPMVARWQKLAGIK